MIGQPQGIAPTIHNRRSIRLKGYDYSQSGAYFVTICTHNREMFFDQYPVLKNIVQDKWQNIPNRHSNIILDEFIVMPNHIHGIIIIDPVPVPVGAGLAPALNNDNNGATDNPNNRATARVAPTGTNDTGINTPTVGEIIGQYKSMCVAEWIKFIKQNNLNILGKFWQRNYYERIIRDENELNRVRQYIIDNPMNWTNDRNYEFVESRQIAIIEGQSDGK